MSAVQVTIEAKLEWLARRSGDSWIGVCEALNLSTEADSLDELHSLIPESIHLLMIDLLEDNELDQFLRDRGWQLVNHLPARGNDVEFNVPWRLVAEGERGFKHGAH